MDINVWAVLVCGVVSMVVGFLWYGPLFGKTWMRIIKVTPEDMRRREEMQKGSGSLYAITFALSLVQAYVMAYYIRGWEDLSGTGHAMLFWLAFIIPTVAAGAMWNNDSKNISWARFGIQAGYYLVLFVLFGMILSMWA